jgi:carboxymethylenebutenolidase
MEEVLAESRTAVGSGAVRLPDAKPISIGHGITVQPPLTRRGHGPPILLLVDHDLSLSSHERTLDPPPLLKWAEEGFCVAQMQVQPALLDADPGEAKSVAAQVLLAALEVVKRTECEPKDKIGLVGK